MRWPWGPQAGFRFPAAELAPAHDGDTISLDVTLGPHARNHDYGFHIYTDAAGYLHLHSNFRVLGENAPELATPAGKVAAEFVQQLLPPGTEVTVTTTKSPEDKYGGRFDATVTLPDGRDLAAVEIAAGVALPWDGHGKRPV